jgi:cytochrome bd-type quinol oxidase subunit 2
MELPAATIELVNAVMHLGAAILAVISLTALGKWLAEKAGKPIEGNQVRLLSAVAALVVALVSGVIGGTIPGVEPLPTGGAPQEWATWLAQAVLPLCLFSNAIWRYVYKPTEETNPPPPTGGSFPSAAQK